MEESGRADGGSETETWWNTRVQQQVNTEKLEPKYGINTKSLSGFQVCELLYMLSIYSHSLPAEW